MLPERAIIKIPTKAEAKCVLEFLELNGVRWASGLKPTTQTFFHVNGSETCYRLIDCKTLFYGLAGYYRGIKYATPNEWYMLSVDEFIDRCTAGETVDNDELSPADLDEIL